MTKRKEGGLIEGFEGPIGTLVREGIRKELPAYMGSLKQRFPDLYYTMAWGFNDQSPEAKSLKDKLMTGLVFTSWIGERLVDLIGSQSSVAKVAEIGFGDLPSSIKDYYEREQPPLPENFKPLTLDQIDAFVAQVNNQVKEYFLNWMKNFRPSIEGLIKKLSGIIPGGAHLFETKLHRFLGTLFGRTDPALDAAYVAFYRRQLEKNIPNQRGFISMIDNFDTEVEFINFFSKLPNDQDVLFTSACQLTAQTGWPRLNDDAQSAISQGGRPVAQALKSVNQGIENHLDQEEVKARKWRKRFLIVGGIGVYVVLMVTLGSALVPSHPLAQALIYLLVFGLPMAVLIRRIGRNKHV